MTQKDAVQTELNRLNIVGNVIFAALIALAIYNLQTSSINVVEVMGAISVANTFYYIPVVTVI